jgi:hypothetical protein
MVTKSTGIITVPGTGTSGFSGDGWPATSAELKTPQSVAVDASENIYIAVDNRILMVTKSTAIIISLSDDGSSAFSGGGGPATLAKLSEPIGVAIDADKMATRIRMFLSPAATSPTPIATSTSAGKLLTLMLHL